MIGDAKFYVEDEYEQMIAGSDNSGSSQASGALSEQRLLRLEESASGVSSDNSSSQTGMSISNSILADEGSLADPKEIVEVVGELNDGAFTAADPTEEPGLEASENSAPAAANDHDDGEQILASGVIDDDGRQPPLPEAETSTPDESEEIVLAGGSIGDTHRDGSSSVSKPAAVDAVKAKKRVVPTLVSDIVPAMSKGNIAGNPSLSLNISVSLPVPALPVDQARLAVQQALRCRKNDQDQLYARIFRRRLKAKSEFDTSDRLSLTDSLEPIAVESLDTFWFFRPAQNRFNRANVKRVDQQIMAAQNQQGLVSLVKLWCDMDLVQRWQRRYISAVDTALLEDQTESDEANDDEEDPVLPVYGDSGTDNEYSDDLRHEIDVEQRETQKRQAKAAEKESQRKALVQQTIRQMCAKFGSEWHEQMLPKLSKSRFYLWRKHQRFGPSLAEETKKLQLDRLPKAKLAIFESGVSKLADIVRLCSGLRRTVYQISDNEWILKLIAGPCPPRPVSKRSSSSRRQAKAESSGNREVINSSEDSGSGYDSLDDFIEDDTEPVPRPNPVETLKVELGVAANGQASRHQTPRQMERFMGPRAREEPNEPKSSCREVKAQRKNMLRARGLTRTKEDRKRVLDQLRHFAWLRGEDEGYSDFSEDRETGSGTAESSSNSDSAKAKTSQVPRPFILSRDGFLQLLSKNSVDEHFDSMLFCIRRMACGLERLSNLAIGDLNEMHRQQLPAIDLHMSMRIWTEFTLWTLVFGPASLDADIAADGITVEYSDPVLRNKRIMQIRESLERSELHAELVRHQEQLPDMCQQRKRLLYAFVDSPVPQWLTEDMQPLLQFTNGSVRRAVVESGCSGLVIGRRWLPMLQRFLAIDQILHKAAFAEFFKWRQHCILDYERPVILASQRHSDLSNDKNIVENSSTNGAARDPARKPTFKP
ncbi:hypothetical protein FB639_002447, partial [Coemansia asiatica]